MSRRQQLPPQIRKITVTDRTSGRPVVRYQVTIDAGISPDTGRRKQTRMRFTTEKDARDHLSATQAAVAVGTYVARSKRTVRQVVDEWVASKRPQATSGSVFRRRDHVGEQHGAQGAM